MPLPPRALHRFDVQAGDLIRIETTFNTPQLVLFAFDKMGNRAEHRLGFHQLDACHTDEFESAALLGWIASQGGDISAGKQAVRLSSMAEPLILKIPDDMIFWAAHLSRAEDLIAGSIAGEARIWHNRKHANIILPEPLGHIRDEFTVRRGTATAYRLSKGEYVQIIDLEGQQCSDFQAFSAQDDTPECCIDGTATRSMVRRAYPAPGLFDKFYDQHMRPLLRLVQDSCGRHDMFGLACTERGYADRGFPAHVNCSDNISNALSPYGIAQRKAWPAVNFFWNTWLDEHHHILTEEAHSRPGDYVVMQAMDELISVSTACPDDIDPINGWNPTDIHVRIYHEDTPVQHAIAYRIKEDAPMHISKPSAFHDRVKHLTSHFTPARDIWLPASFPAHGTIGEYWACRTAATLQDMSSLRKIDIIGPDAEALLQFAMSRDIAKLAQWRGIYALLCDGSGEVIDDGTLFRLEPHLFRWCCGAEESGRWLSEIAQQHGYQVRIHDLGGGLPNLALQGPESRNILRKILFTQPHVPNLDQLKWFGVTTGRLENREGAPFMLSRTGYTAELGYEIFCAEKDALTLWDAIMQAGEEYGITPMGSDALEIIRIEAGFMSRAEFAPGVDAFEAGLGFAVDLKKAEFMGKQALERHQLAPRKKLCGLCFTCDDVPRSAAPVYIGERQIGEITSATRSPKLETAIAMARLNVEYAHNGVEVEVGMLDGRMKRLSAKIVDLPFTDPKRERARA